MSVDCIVYLPPTVYMTDAFDVLALAAGMPGRWERADVLAAEGDDSAGYLYVTDAIEDENSSLRIACSLPWVDEVYGFSPAVAHFSFSESFAYPMTDPNYAVLCRAVITRSDALSVALSIKLAKFYRGVISYRANGKRMFYGDITRVPAIIPVRGKPLTDYQTLKAEVEPITHAELLSANRLAYYKLGKKRCRLNAV